jgi:hypothetical protein
MKKRQAKEKSAALAIIAARNNVQTTTAATATNTATSGGPTPEMPPQNRGHLIDYVFTMRGRVRKGGHNISVLVAY